MADKGTIDDRWKQSGMKVYDDVAEADREYKEERSRFATILAQAKERKAKEDTNESHG